MRDVILQEFATAVHFKRLTPEKLKEDGSFNLVDKNGQLIGIFVVPISPFKEDQIQAWRSQMNAALGKE